MFWLSSHIFSVYQVWWEKDGRPVDGTGGVRVKHRHRNQSQLTVRRAGLDHLGVYVCYTRHGDGQHRIGATSHVANVSVPPR